MAAVKAGDFKPPELRRERVSLPDAGEAWVRALLLTERLTLRRKVAELATSNAEGSLEVMIPRLLAVAVVDDDGAPLLTAQQWDEYGATHVGVVLDLFNKAADLSGLSIEAAEKNSEASRT